MEAQAPFISVVIPTYNRATVIGDTIRSVMAQTFQDFEIIVVDDGSTDNTADVVAGFGNAVRLIRQPNKGITGARNTGLRAARGTWIALQDSDDTWLPEKLAEHVKDLNAHPELKVFFVDAWLQRTHLGTEAVLSFDHSGFSSHLQSGFTVIPRPLWHQIRYGVAWVQGTLIRHDLIKAIGLYDESLTIFTDYDLFCRLALHAPWGINRTPLVRIQRLADDKSYVSSQRTKTPEKAYRTMSYIMEKLLAQGNLTPQEGAIVRDKLYGSLSGWGNALWQKGDTVGARSCFTKAFRVRQQPGALLKLIATWVLRRKRTLK